MNKKKFFLLLITVCALGNTFQIRAMRPIDKEDKEPATGLLLKQLFNPKPNLGDISKLIQQGADVNAGNDLGLRLLHAAAISNNLPLAKLLITNNAFIDVTDNDGNTPLHFACEEGSMDVIKLLYAKGANVSAKNNVGNTPLHFACTQGSMDVIKFLCEKGANINSINNIKDSPLHMACAAGHFNVVEFLISKGALVNTTNENLITPLHAACRKGIFKIVEFLIKNKADITAKSYKGATLLHFACIPKNSGPIITLLIKKGADVNAVIKKTTWTPLHIAVAENNAQACTLLLKAGADTSIATSDGMTALDLAYDQENKNIAIILQSYSRQTNAEADANMQKFFEELNQETVSKKKKTAKKRRKKTPQPTVEMSTKANSTNFPELSSEITADELMINQLIEEQQIEPIVPTAEIVIETPSTASPVVQPTPSAPSQERPIKIAQQISQEPSTINEPAPHHDGYLILIGQNLKWPHLNKNQEQLIKNNLLSLKNWPTHNLDIKQLKGETHMYRLRVGNYRIIFAVDTARREIKVQKIGLRKEVYKQYKS